MTPCFVLCPGWAMPADFLQALGEALRARYPGSLMFHVTLASLRKRGRPVMTRLAAAAPPQARWIGIGHSMGFALLLRARWPWAGLVSIAGFNRFADPLLPAAEARAAVQGLRDAVWADLPNTLRRFYRRCGLKPGECGVVSSFGAPQLSAQLDLLTRLDVRRDLSQIRRWRIPVLALAAGRDQIVPSHWSRHQFANGTVVWHPQAQHALGGHEADWCAQRVADWMRIKRITFACFRPHVPKQ